MLQHKYLISSNYELYKFINKEKVIVAMLSSLSHIDLYTRKTEKDTQWHFNNSTPFDVYIWVIRIDRFHSETCIFKTNFVLTSIGLDFILYAIEVKVVWLTEKTNINYFEMYGYFKLYGQMESTLHSFFFDVKVLFISEM